MLRCLKQLSFALKPPSPGRACLSVAVLPNLPLLLQMPLLLHLDST